MQHPTQHQPEHNQEFNDEIDLADLVRSLWKGKWLVIGITFFTVMLALAYLVLVPKTYTGSLEIAALPSATADVYTELNATEFIKVDEQVLLSAFIDDIRSYDGIEYFIKTYGYITQQEDETDREFAFRLRQTAYDFSLVPPTPQTAKNFQPNWVLNITTQNTDMASQLLADSLVLSNQNVNQQMVSAFQRRRDEQARKNKYAIEDVDLRKQRALATYEIDTMAKLALLDEQAQIARDLDLSNGSFSAQTYSNASTVITSSGKDEPIYLRGYLAIEKEIKMILTRQSANPFISELADIENSKLQLLQDKTVTRANELLANTPIGTEQFSAVVYDLASVEYKSKSKATLVLALALVLGGLLGIFVLLIRNALIKKD
jgi:chain length determinant protein (polysaccharide antigen chain regulator)